MDTPEFKFLISDGLGEEFLPTRAKPNDTGWDVRCAVKNGITIAPFDYVLIPLGIKMIAPEGYWLELVPRSSGHAKKNLNCLYGKIDQTYTGEIMLSAQYLPGNICSRVKSIFHEDKFLIDQTKMHESIKIEFGERIGQVIPVKRQDMKVSMVTAEAFTEYVKATGGRDGFGHTGK